MKEIRDKFNSAQYHLEASKSFWEVLDYEPGILNEISVDIKSSISLVHRETSVIISSENGFNINVIKYSFYIKAHYKKKGTYDYLIDFDGNFIDEFLVID